MSRMELIAIEGIPRVEKPTPLAPLLLEALARAGLSLQPGDILVLAHKIVSKAEGRVVALDQVVPSPAALELAQRTDKDPRLVELILQESREIVRIAPGLIVAEHRCGTISANAGIDLSNSGGTGDRAVLLPLDPDASAARLREELARACGVEVGVIICDTQGRPFRQGAVGVAIGVAGLEALKDWRGQPDLYGRTLQSSQEAVADELAAAATLLMGQSHEARPAVIVRGLALPKAEGSARQLVRPREKDLFRGSPVVLDGAGKPCSPGCSPRGVEQAGSPEAQG